MEHSNKWRNTLTIKHLLSHDSNTTSPEKTIEICNCVISQLNIIKKREETSNLIDDEKWNIGNKIEELVGSFVFLKDMADGSIPKDEWADYYFDGNFQEWLNGNLSTLYDLGDEKVITKNNIIEKFIWIN